jgi:hypothetical protein
VRPSGLRGYPSDRVDIYRDAESRKRASQTKLWRSS